MTKQDIIISTSFDRTVYPLNSIMHIKVRINKIIKNELVYLEICNQKKRIITIAKINPEKSKNLEKSDDYLYQTNIIMHGNEWRTGTYTLFARYANAEASDSMIISKGRKPFVKTDRSVYLIGGDMVVTVIAPDLDKDNEKPETIGNHKDHTLTILSRFGTLKNYKLRETGDSTGIFQGLVGLILPYSIKNGKKIKNKARGNGPVNGYLPVGLLGEEIIIEFKSKSGNSRYSAFSSNFGVAVELDQKIYCPTDKVYLTIVAPDYNIDSNKLDSIGNDPYSKITISTSKGEISNYKLVETGTDTGIFVGEITLTGSKEIFTGLKGKSNFGITKGNGPTNGHISCSANDKLTVKFENAFSDVYKSTAKISFTLGEIQFDKDIYSKSSTVKITVIDPDMNLNPTKNDSFDIRIWSDSDLKGLKICVKETNEATGIFEGSILLSDESIPIHKKLKVAEGDRIFAKYVDYTLPQTFKGSKQLDILTTAKIQSNVVTKSTVKILKNASTLHDDKYMDPEILVIKSGDTVNWINDDSEAHTVTSGTPSNGPASIFDSPILMPKNNYEQTFNQKGTFDYFCLIHPWKIGKIIVK
jgi:plastocyanin